MNILTALANLSKYNSLDFPELYKSKIRINAAGESLEYFIKDLFADSLALESIDKRQERYQRIFSWLGNQNNPPDFIIKEGDSFEVKKLAGFSGSIALNSSFPKDYLHIDDPRIVEGCRRCENWTKKDLVYVVGVVDKRQIVELWFVYGSCYAADRSVYDRITNPIKEAVSNVPNIEISETSELGKVKKVDPLGITDLRVRGMWNIKSPFVVFKDQRINKSNVYAIMLKNKYDECFGKLDGNKKDNTLSFSPKEISIPDPNNPAKNLEAILLNKMI